MKKSLIALAVAAALPAFAQAQTNVQLYGIMDLGVGYKDLGGNTSSAFVVDPGYQSTNRFGIRGSEDLGGGLSATFNLEAGLNTDTGDQQSSPGLFQRRSVVGLKGGFGEVNIGRDYTSGFSAAGTTDIMGYSFFGNWLNFTAGATQGTSDQGLGIQTRASNGIHYKSPSFGNTKCMSSTPSTECGPFSGGLNFAGFYSAGENTDSSNAGEAYGGALVYKGGPLTAQGYWQTVAAKAPAALNYSGDIDVDQYGAGLGWNFGIFRLAANYGQAEYTAAGQDIQSQAYALGGAMKLGPGELLVNYMQRKIRGSILKPLNLGEPKADTWGIAYTYPMSKRTNLYATWGMVNNNSDGAYALVYSQSSYKAASTGADLSAFAVGVRHVF